MKKIILFFILSAFLFPIVCAEPFFLKQNLFEGESRDYDVGGYIYHIELSAVFDTQQKAQFIINGERTDALSEDEDEKLVDGARIQVRDVLPQESGDGKDLVQFNFFPAAHNESNKPAVTTSTVPTKTPNVTTTSAKPQAAVQEQAAVAEPAAQHQKVQATVDITKKMSEKNWWTRFTDWLSGIFK